MVGKCGLGEEGQREVENVRGLHRPQQGLPEVLNQVCSSFEESKS